MDWLERGRRFFGGRRNGGGRALNARSVELFEAFVAQARERNAYSISVGDVEAGKALLAGNEDVRRDGLLAAIRWQSRSLPSGPTEDWICWFAVRKLVSVLLRKPIMLDEQDLLKVLVPEEGSTRLMMDFPTAGAVGVVERFLENNTMTADLYGAIEGLKTRLEPYQGSRENRELVRRIDVILGQAEPAGDLALMRGDAWSDRVLAELEEMDGARQAAWRALLRYGAGASSSKPSARWLKGARTFIEAVGEREFVERVCGWLECVGKEGSARVVMHGQPLHDGTVLQAENTDVLKGLVWSAATVDDPRLMGAVGTAAEISFKKIPGYGPRSVKLGNACLQYLSLLEGDGAVAELVRLKARAKHPSIRKQVDKAVARLAVKRGQTAEDLVELGVPTFGLDGAGVRKQAVGGFVAELSIVGTAEAELVWRGTNGKVVKSVPKAAKEADPEGVKELVKAKREIERALSGQRDKLERLLLSQRSWKLVDWKARYVEHPLLAHMCGRLIWEFSKNERTGLALWRDGKLVTPSGELDWVDQETTVRLWHPISSAPAEVAAWREVILGLKICQPFKQAHREVYLLTDAERGTRVYSNRFAAHILRQHQMAALCQQRGWAYRLQGGFDGANSPTRELPELGLKVEFMVDLAGDGENLTGAGIGVYVATDQVVFYGGMERRPLEQVPRIVFSEVMRDVDLLVGVCSIGNNPQWQDGGADGRYGDYWREFSFGELSETGKGRKELLERLLPRLKIGAVSEVREKFLVVKGKLRTYKIHLGSGNILMEPNDQYLCIVPGGRGETTGTWFLPYEGDRTLSIILSKAVMLAEDEKIKDQSILHQIRR